MIILNAEVHMKKKKILNHLYCAWHWSVVTIALCKYIPVHLIVDHLEKKDSFNSILIKGEVQGILFLDPRGPLGIPSSVRLVCLQQKYKSHLKPYKSSQDHARPPI